jgi:hypothetical protein
MAAYSTRHSYRENPASEKLTPVFTDKKNRLPWSTIRKRKRKKHKHHLPSHDRRHRDFIFNKHTNYKSKGSNNHKCDAFATISHLFFTRQAGNSPYTLLVVVQLPCIHMKLREAVDWHVSDTSNTSFIQNHNRMIQKIALECYQTLLALSVQPCARSQKVSTRQSK